MTTHAGQCFCRAVKFEVEGEAEGMGYCHCTSCRAWSGGPVNSFTLWKPERVTVREGSELISTFHKTEMSHRQFCARCGGHIMTRHPSLDLVDICAGAIPELPFTPALHVNYQETVLPIRDGLPKFRDFPAEVGGSGEMIEE